MSVRWMPAQFFLVFFREKGRASFHHVDDDDGMTQS